MARKGVLAADVGLLCLAGRARIVVPASDVVQVIEYPVSARLPLAARFVGGLGVFEGRVVISVALDSRLDGVAERLTKAVLVRRGGPLAAAWAIEVSEVRALCEVSGEAVPGVVDHPDKASFVSWRKTGADELVGWIDVAAMIAALSRGRASNVT